MTTKTYLPWWR